MGTHTQTNNKKVQNQKQLVLHIDLNDLIPRFCLSDRLQSDHLSPLLLTVIQRDEKYSLNHVIYVELFTQLLPGSKGAADLCHRVVIFINTV